MKGCATLAAVALLTLACGGSQSSAASNGASPQATSTPFGPFPSLPAFARPSATPSASPSPSPSPTAPVTPSPSLPSASVACAGRAAGTSTVLVGEGGQFGDTAIYDVTNPLAPKLLCRVKFTTAHLSSATGFEYLDPRSPTETDVVLDSYAGSAEGLAGKLPAWADSAAWLPTGALGAYTVMLSPSADCPAGGEQVWRNVASSAQLLYTYCIGIGDCICRFTMPRPVLAISPDGQYLVAGHLSGKGSEGLRVYRLSDGVEVYSFGNTALNAFWSRSSDRLYAVAATSPEVWTYGQSPAPVPGASNWSYFPNVSPDNAYIAYTAYADQTDQTQPRVYLFNLAAGTTRLLIDQPRSQAVFVKDGWVWYLEEASCAECPSGTQPTGKVYAMNVATGVEQPVIFAAGENIPALDWFTLSPGEFWPNA